MSLTKNVIFNSLLTVSNYIFPFILFPYVSRVLGPENLGKCDYVDSWINYFMLLSTLGISYVGIREIVASRDDRVKINRTFTSLLLITSVSTLIAICLLVVLTFTLSAFSDYKSLLLIGILKLLGNFFLIEWFYKGLEDFKYITLRTILVKTIYLIAVFVFIRTSSDYMVYYLLLCLMVVINAIVNCWKASKMVSIDFNELDLVRYLKPLLVFSLYFALTTMYVSFNVSYLGLKGNDTEVGYFSAASKFFGIMIGLYTAFTSVMMPRLTSLNNKDADKEFKHLINISYDILFAFAIPALIFGIIYAHSMIAIFAGAQFSPAALPMQIMMPLVLIIGYEQIVILQILAPKKKDRAILINSSIGAMVGIILNVVLVPRLLVVGTAITWVCSELVVLISAQYFVQRYIGLRFPVKMFATYCLAYAPVAAVLLLMKTTLQLSDWSHILTGSMALAVYVTIAHLLMKSEVSILFKSKLSLIRCKTVAKDYQRQ